MDPQQADPNNRVGTLVQTHDRPVCHTVQPSSASVCVSGPGPPGLRHRRPSPSLVRPHSLRLPSLPDPPQGDQEGETRETQAHSHSPVVAHSVLVPGPQVPHSRTPSPVEHQVGHAQATPFGSPSLQPPDASPPRLASVPARLRASKSTSRTDRSQSVLNILSIAGASQELRDLAMSSRRASTESLYDYRWRKWVSWCKDNSVPHNRPSNIQIGNFLSHLNLSASSIRGYRSAICTTIRQMGGPSFENDFLLREISRGAALREAQSPRRFPLWDLFTVLDVLNKPPFEPVSSIPFDLLSMKTTFLLALASARRRGEIHALSGDPRDIAFHRDGSVSLKFLPEFLAKNQEPGSASPYLVIRPLADTLGGDTSSDIALCPSRCLTHYWERSRPRRVSQRRLLISINPSNTKDISAGTVSRWLSKTVRTAYSQASKDLPVLSPRAHEVRALAASAAFQHSVPMRHLLEAAFWRSENPFIKFYLRDIRMTRADGSNGISFVAANASISGNPRNH